MKRLIKALISNDPVLFHRTFHLVQTKLSLHNLPTVSARLTEIVQLWSSETPEMEQHDKEERQESAQRHTPASKISSTTAKVTSSFASRAKKPAQHSHQDENPHEEQVAQQEHTEVPTTTTTTTHEGKGKGKMPAGATGGKVSPSRLRSESDPDIDPHKYTRTDEFLEQGLPVPTHEQRARASKSVDTDRRGRSRYRSSRRPQHQSEQAGLRKKDDGGEQPNDSNDWGVEQADGVLVGRPPAYPAGLLDWDDKDRGKTVAEVAPDHMTRVKTVAASAASSTLRTAQGTLRGLLTRAAGVGAGVRGGSGNGSKDKENEGKQKNLKEGGGQQEQQKKKKGKGREEEKRGKFVKEPREQQGPDHVYEYSDYYDSEDGSDWVTL